MRTFRRLSLLAFAFLATVAMGQEDLSKAIHGLRDLPDSQRGAATERLALKIRALPRSHDKSLMALGLAFISTEGDPGKRTLQAVADTLAATLREMPEPEENGAPAMGYRQLAEMQRYEGLTVKLDDPEYRKAQAALDKIDKDRAKVDFALNGLDGKKWKLSDLRGKVVLVNFWATWCPPCRKEMPDLESLQSEFKGKGLVVLALSSEAETVVRSFVEKNGYTFPILLDPGDQVSKQFHVDGIPKSFVFDRKGRLAALAMDMRTRNQFLRLLAKAGLE